MCLLVLHRTGLRKRSKRCEALDDMSESSCFTDNEKEWVGVPKLKVTKDANKELESDLFLKKKLAVHVLSMCD